MARRKDPNDIVVVGAAAHPLRDAYHLVLEMRWSSLFLSIAVLFIAINALFAAGYLAVGGIEGARPGVFRDAFFFSVQTMGTIGYGAMYPKAEIANVLVVAESIAGLILTALATGIVFARFSRTTGELIFSRYAVISPMDGVPTLSFRVGNDRSSTIFEARVSVTFIRTEKTAEGQLFYRMYDLDLVRSRSQALARSFTVMHRITETSPLFEASPETCKLAEVEIGVNVVGTDGTSLQPVHASYRYDLEDLIWGARLADVLSERSDGRLELDVRKFHDVVRTTATEAFPYPKPVRES